MFEHHYDNMIVKNYTFRDINNFLKMNNFNQIYKSKMPFRKTFEYIYKREELNKLKDIKASVLIANYNNEQYLTECIASIKKQTYQNVEIIIHDDSSSDNSIKRINKYKNITIIKNRKRGKYGSYNQMNAYYRAFKKSNGEIIFLLDSDDLYKRNKIKTVINAFSKNKKISSLFDLTDLQK